MKFNKGDKVIITNSESIWDGYSGKVLDEIEEDSDEIRVKINFQTTDSDEIKHIIQIFPLSDLVLDIKTEMLAENIIMKDHKFMEDKDYIKNYLLKFDIDGELKPAWIFAEIIATSENKDVGQIIADAEKFKHKIFRVTADNFDKIIIANKDYTEDDIKDEYGDFLLGTTCVEDCTKR